MDSRGRGTQAMTKIPWMSVRPSEVPKMTGQNLSLYLSIYIYIYTYYYEDVYFLLKMVEFANEMLVFTAKCIRFSCNHE